MRVNIIAQGFIINTMRGQVEQVPVQEDNRLVCIQMNDEEIRLEAPDIARAAGTRSIYQDGRDKHRVKYYLSYTNSGMTEALINYLDSKFEITTDDFRTYYNMPEERLNEMIKVEAFRDAYGIRTTHALNFITCLARGQEVEFSGPEATLILLAFRTYKTRHCGTHMGIENSRIRIRNMGSFLMVHIDAPTPDYLAWLRGQRHHRYERYPQLEELDAMLSTVAPKKVYSLIDPVFTVSPAIA